MPLVNATQTFNIVLRNEDFGSKYELDAPSYQSNAIRIGKWIEVVPTQLLTSTRKLFIDITNTKYTIDNINQAIRLFIRPLCFFSGSQYSSQYCSCGSLGFNTAFGTNRLFYTNDDLGLVTAIYKYENLVTRAKNALGKIPDEYLVNTFYLSGKFLADQPHIEHLNSGLYSIYNNLRCITLTTGSIINIDWDTISNGFIVNSYYANPKASSYSNPIWTFDYANFSLEIKYIIDIVDLINSYLSYGIMYERYLVIVRSGLPGTWLNYNTKKYVIDSERSYSVFEFFLAPVGEAS